MTLHRQTWTEEADAILHAELAKRTPSSRIAEILTAAGFPVTKNSVLGRSHRQKPGKPADGERMPRRLNENQMAVYRRIVDLTEGGKREFAGTLEVDGITTSMMPPIMRALRTRGLVDWELVTPGVNNSGRRIRLLKQLDGDHLKTPPPGSRGTTGEAREGSAAAGSCPAPGAGRRGDRDHARRHAVVHRLARQPVRRQPRQHRPGDGDDRQGRERTHAARREGEGAARRVG